MNISRYILFAACLPILAEAVDVKTCYVKINGWDMRGFKETGLPLPVPGNRILAVDVTIQSDYGVYDKLIRSGEAKAAHSSTWPHFNRRGGFWRLGNSTIYLDAGSDPGQTIGDQKTYFRDGHHVQTNRNRGWIRILHTGNQCSVPQPVVKTKVIMIQNFDMLNNSGMVVNNIHNWFGGSSAFQNIKGKILGFTTTVVSEPDNNGYASRYLTDLTMIPTGCGDNNNGGRGCGQSHLGGSASIETASNRLHLTTGDWYERPDELDNWAGAPTRPLRGSLFDNSGEKMFLRVDYYQ